MPGGDYHWDGGTGWVGGLLMLLAMIVFWGGLVTLVILAIRHFSGASGGGTSGGRSSARAILDERFARGDIDEQEYRTRRQVLDR
jgi:putative membrane protein